MLRMLSSEYPTSPFAAKAPGVIAGLDRAATPARASSAPASSRSAPTTVATITGIQRTVLPDSIRVVISLDAAVSFRDERLANPDRVYVDISPTRLAPGLVDQTLRFDGDTYPVRQIRTGRHPNDTSRIVLEAAGVASCHVHAMDGPHRVVIECLPRTAMSPPARTAAPAVTPLAPVAAAPPPAAAPPAVQNRADLWTPALPAPPAAPGLGVAPPAPVAPPVRVEAVPPPATTPPARNLAGGLSMARQLGLGVSRIVIDPGHGGQDPGAKGAGATEADLVLDIALRLERLLLETPGVEVILTRRTDEFVPLEERTAIANRAGADLFLSIHANASNNTQATGVETYFLNFATNLSAASVAARENAASGQAMGALPDYVKTIALNNKLDESRDFATLVQREMIAKLTPANRAVKDLGVKEAPFVVLIGAAMPSVLAEVSFLTNAQEAKLLKGAAYRQRIAEALLNAIHKYQGTLKPDSTITQR
jgi:N-acetylmuramoyl-L-alanine amidase